MSEVPLELGAHPAGLVAALAGSVGSLAVAGALVAWREPLGLANVGFVMVLVVLAAAIAGGRRAGIVTAATAALAFNYFHTQPYLSLAVAAREDAVSVALLAVVGALVGEIGARASLRHGELQRAVACQRDTDLLLAALAAGATIEEVWSDVRAWLCSGPSVERAAFAAADHPLPPDVADELARTYVLPVAVDGQEMGRLVLTLRSSRIDRASAELGRRAASLLAVLFALRATTPGTLG